MTQYEDEALLLDERGATIKSSMYPGQRRFVDYDAIRSVGVFQLGPSSGRHRLVGIGFRRPRHFFHWDRQRSAKSHAIELDTGQTIRIVITPADHRAALVVLEQRVVR